MNEPTLSGASGDAPTSPAGMLPDKSAHQSGVVDAVSQAGEDIFRHHQIEVHNADCMEVMARFPDKYFELAIVALLIDKSKKKDIIWHADFKRITNRKSWRIPCMRRLNLKGLHRFSKRARLAIRRCFRHWFKAFASSGKDHIGSKDCSSTQSRFAGLRLFRKARREGRENPLLISGNRSFCACLLGHKASRLSNPSRFTSHNQYPGGCASRKIQRRKRRGESSDSKNPLFKGHDHDASSEGIGHARFHGFKNFTGRICPA